MSPIQRSTLALALLPLLAPEGAARPAPQLSFIDEAPALGLQASSLGRGAAMVDMDGDGRLDLMTADDRTPMNAFRQRSDGSFEDAVGLWSVPQYERRTFCILVADFDNDGDEDVFRANGGRGPAQPNELFRNDIDQSAHAGALVDVSDQAGDVTTALASHGAAALDYDRDGQLDLFVASASFMPSQLLRNTGGLVFEDVTVAAGFTSIGNARHCGAGDFDNDGWPDLAVSGYDDPIGNRLWRNQTDGTFANVTAAFGIDDAGESNFGCVFTDVDQDGWLDIYVPKLTFEVGPVPNRVFRNVGGTSLEVAAEFGLRGAMGHTVGDLDQDGFPEIWSGTGNPLNAYDDELFRNLSTGPGSVDFVDISVESGITATPPTRSHGAAFGDLDGDGDVDVYINNGGAAPGAEGENFLWSNQGNGNHWIAIELEGVLSNRSAVGARAVATTASGRRIHRDRQVGIGFGNTHSPPLRFGLAGEAAVEEIEITWPSGIVQRLVEPALEVNHPVLETGLRLVGTPQPGGSVTAEFAGPAGWRAELFLALGTASVPLPELGGVLELAPPILPLWSGSLGTEGQVEAPLPIPVAPGSSGATVWLQAWIHPVGELAGTLGPALALELP